jgi:uncharacterized protein YgbK (DUF1537 family)
MSSETHANGTRDNVMLVGIDNKQIIQKRLQAAGCRVIKVADEETALDQVRHNIFDKAVMISSGSLINMAEMIFNLRDLNRSMEIIILVGRLGKHTNRLLRQLLQHPIEGTQIMTRRELQKALHGAAPPAAPGKEL